MVVLSQETRHVDHHPERRDFFITNYDRFERSIVSEIDIMDAVGDLFKERSANRLLAETDRSGLSQVDGMVESPRASSLPVSAAFDEEEQDRAVPDQTESGSPIDQRTVQCISDCFEEFCFFFF